MVNEKQKNLATINTLYIQSKLQKSKRDIENGKVMTVEESKERMRKKYESFDVT